MNTQPEALRLADWCNTFNHNEMETIATELRRRHPSMEQHMTDQKTPWFPSSIKPVRAGVYEVFTPNSRANKYAYFDKAGWRLCASSIEDAAKDEDWLGSNWVSSMTLPQSMWRGFTKEQK